MQIYNGITEIRNLIQKSVVTIGNFDGLHVGHREIISRLIERSKEVSAPSVLMTFFPHPRKVLHPEKNIKSIFGREDLEHELSKLGLDILIFEPFSRELSQMKAEDFIKNKIYKPLSPHTLIVGYDFAFGSNREGTLESLKSTADILKIHLEIVSPVKKECLIVSSTLIRTAIEEGRVELAETLLSRPFFLKGIVEKGDARGKQIGFPTINLSTRAELFPKKGVYATQTRVGGKDFNSITNVGENPTFKSDLEKPPTKIETYIFDFNKNVYGEEVTVSFKKFIRDEKKFNSVSELVAQIKLDVELVKGLKL